MRGLSVIIDIRPTFCTVIEAPLLLRNESCYRPATLSPMNKLCALFTGVLISTFAYSQQFLHNPWKIGINAGMHMSFLGDDPREPSWEQFLIVPYRLNNPSSHFPPTQRGNQGYRIQAGPTLSIDALHEKGYYLGVSGRYSYSIDPSPDWIYYGQINSGEYLAEKISYSLWQSNVTIGYNLLREKWNARKKSNLIFVVGGGITGGKKWRGYHYKTLTNSPDTASAYEQFVVDYSGWNWTLGLKYRWYANPSKRGLGLGIDLVRNSHRLYGNSMTRKSYFRDGTEQLDQLPTRDREYILDGRANDNANDSSAPMHLNQERNEAWEWSFSFYVSYRL